MGISREVRAAAAECARDLEEASAGLASCQEALIGGDEAEARAYLERRAGIREQMTRAQGESADAFGRVTRMEAAVSMLTERSRSIEAAMSRAVAVSAESSAVAR